MKKAWSGFWLVIASVVAINIIGAMLQPWFLLIGITLTLVVSAVIVIYVLKARRKKRQFF